MPGVCACQDARHMHFFYRIIIEIIENTPLEIESNKHNKLYLKTKRDKMGHTLKNLDV